MTQPDKTAPKPISETVRPQLTRLPRLTLWRKLVRHILLAIIRLLVYFFVEIKAKGLENIPNKGAILMVANHLGDADAMVGAACIRRFSDPVAKAELYKIPILGILMHAYGVIWIHRGRPDRRALRAALQGLNEGRMVSIAPEGRESVTGALEEGTNGAAFLALKANAPIVPVTFTGTENKRIYGNIKRLHRTRVTITVGKPFYLDAYPDRRKAIRRGTQTVMSTLAKQLPPEYRGVYQSGSDAPYDSK